MIDCGNGKQRRPNTTGTVTMWLNTHPEPGSCLIIASQPYAHYQEAVVKKLLSSTEYHVETAACESLDQIGDGDHLDNLAQWMYQWEVIKS